MPDTDRRTFVTAAATMAAASASPVLAQGGEGAAKPTTPSAAAYPKPPFAVQRQPWPGLASKMDPRPDHGEQSYKGSGKNGALLVSLGDAAVAVLAELKASGRDDTYVIAGQRKGAPLVNLQKPWRALRALAGLDDVRLHDLRHTFASIGAGMGMSLHMLGRLLGHTQAATTSRYAHLAQDPVRTAADAIGAELMRLTGAAPYNAAST